MVSKGHSGSLQPALWPSGCRAPPGEGYLCMIEGFYLDLGDTPSQGAPEGASSIFCFGDAVMPIEG